MSAQLGIVHHQNLHLLICCLQLKVRLRMAFPLSRQARRLFGQLLVHLSILLLLGLDVSLQILDLLRQVGQVFELVCIRPRNEIVKLFA